MSNWHESYLARYKQLKQAGKSFFPYAIYKDTLMAVFLLILLGTFSIYFGAQLEDLADPTDSTYNPRPEWYFFFLFEALKFFPGWLEPVAAVGIPGLAVVALILLPLLDRSRRRHPLDRPILTLLGAGTLVGMIYLTYRGITSPLVNPIVEKDPVVAQGHRLFEELKCSYCHTVQGKGGHVGPDLSKVAGRHDKDWITKHFRDPQSVTPGSVMPSLHLLDPEIAALSAYVLSLGPGPFTPEAPKLFAANCATCHRVGKQGGQVGPDLSLIGTARDKSYIKQYMGDPSKMNPNATMPGFKERLSDVQMEDLARYLASQKGS